MGVKAADVKVGDSRTLVVFDDLTRTQIVMYAGASGDYNPLHSDEIFTTKVAGYPSVFAHGMLSMGATGRVLTDWFGADRIDQVRRALRQPGLAGRHAHRDGHRRAVREDNGEHFADLTVTTVNQDDTPVVTGSATAKLEP